MNNIPTQNSINSVIQSITSNNKLTEQIMTSTIGTISKILDKQNNFEKNISKMNSLKKYVSNYTSIVSDVINLLCKQLPGEGKTLSDLLGRIENKKSDGSGDSTVAWTTIEATQQIGKIIENVFKTIDNLSKFKINFKVFVQLKKNIYVLKSVLKDCLLTFADAFYPISSNSKMSGILSTLIKQPDIVKTHIEYGYDKDGNQQIKSKGDQSVQGRLGFLDIVDRALSVINSVNNLKFPNFIRFHIQLKHFEHRLNAIINSMFDMFSKINENNKLAKMLPTVSNIISGGTIKDSNNNNETEYQGIYQIIIKLQNVLDTMTNMHISKKVMNHIISTFNNTKKILDSVIKLISSDAMLSLSDPSHAKTLTTSTQNIKTSFSIMDVIVSHIYKAKLINIFKKMILKSIKSIAEICGEIVKLTTDKTISDSNAFSELEDIINSLVTISKKFSILGLLAIPATIGLLLEKGFVKLLVRFVNAVDRLSNIVSNKSTKRIQRGLKNIEKILASLLIIGLTITAFTTLSPIIITSIIVGLLPFLLSLLLVTFTIWITSKLLSKLTISALPNVISFSVTFAVIMGLILISGIAILITAKIANQISEDASVWKIITLLLGMCALAAVVILLGIGVSAIAAIVAPALLGFGAIAAVFIMIVSIAENINELANTTIKSAVAKTKIKEIFKIVNALKSEITTGDRKTWKRNKKLLKHVDASINEILDIANKIKELEKLNSINLEDIVGSADEKGNFKNGVIQKIFKCISIINEQLDNNLYDKTFALTTRRKQVKTKKRMRRNNKVLNKSEKIINNLADIVEPLLAIKEFDITTEKEGGKTIDTVINNAVTNIFSCIDKINQTITEKAKTYSASKSDIKKLTPLIECIRSIGESCNSVAGVDSKNFNSNVESFGKFVDKINLVDIQKLENATKIFNQMAVFSNSIKNDFEKMTSTLAENMLPVLIDLRNIMDGIPGRIDQSAQNISKSVNLSKSPNTKENVTTQALLENPNLSSSDINKLVTQRMNEMAKADANGISAKLDELLILLRGFNGEQIVVRTI